MKKHYENPQATEEAFVSNEYVAACYSMQNGSASIYCVLPGSSSTTIDSGEPYYYEGSGTAAIGKENIGVPHGSCWTGGVLEHINGHTATGHEGGSKSTVTVTDVNFGEEASRGASVTSSIGTAPETLETNKWYKATWNSSYDGQTYHHVGLVNITAGSVVRDTTNRS